MRKRYMYFIQPILALLYVVWFIIQLGLLFYSSESEDNNMFWPFISEDETIRSTYGLSEFIVYTSLPLLIALIIRFFRKNNTERETENQSSSYNRRENFLSALLREKIKSEELQQELNALRQQPVDRSKLEEYKRDLDKLTGPSQWMVRSALRKKYRELSEE